MKNDNNKVDYFLIGAQKAGTTTLYSWLSQHPEINAPEALKDFHFFSSQEYFPKGYDWFIKLYKNEPSPKINGAVNYIFQTEVPEKIKAYNPEAKFIVILRDPVKRAYSGHQFFKKLNVESLSFSEALEKEKRGELSSSSEKDDFAYIDHGMYHKQLQHWLQYFDRDKFHILLYEELFQNPEDYLPEIFNFLNVDPNFKPLLKTKNVSGEVKYRTLNKLIYNEKSPLKIFLNRTGAKHLLPMKWRGDFLNKFRDINTKSNGTSEKITEQEYLQLQPLFEKDINNLSALLDKDLKEIWKY